MKAGVIGMGKMGTLHADVYRGASGVDFIGGADLISGHMSPGELLALKPDLVSICVPTDAHYEMTMMALSLGVHVLVEKPIAMTESQAYAMRDEATDAGLLLSVGHIERYNPAVKGMERLFPKLGHNEIVSVVRNGPPPADRSSGVTLDLMIHDLDLMRRFMGEPIKVEGISAPLTSGAMVQFPSAFALLQASWLAVSPKRRTWDIIGTKGVMHADLLAGTLEFNGESQFVPNFPPPLLTELTAFIKAVRDGGTPPVPADDAIAAMALANAINR